MVQSKHVWPYSAEGLYRGILILIYNYFVVIFIFEILFQDNASIILF